jgi:hypothetical protein
MERGEVLKDFMGIVSPSLTNRVNNNLISSLILRKDSSLATRGIFRIDGSDGEKIMAELYELSKLLVLQEQLL